MIGILVPSSNAGDKEALEQAIPPKMKQVFLEAGQALPSSMRLLVIATPSALPSWAWPMIHEHLATGGNLLYLGDGESLCGTLGSRKSNGERTQTAGLSKQLGIAACIREYRQTRHYVPGPLRLLELEASLLRGIPPMLTWHLNFTPETLARMALHPLIYGLTNKGQIASSPALACDHHLGPYKGARWVFLVCDLPENWLNSEWGAGLAKHLVSFAMGCPAAAYLRPSRPVYTDEENPRLRFLVADIAETASVEIEVTRSQDSHQVLHRSVSTVGCNEEVRLPATSPGVYYCRLKVLDHAGRAVGMATNGYVLTKTETSLLAQNHASAGKRVGLLLGVTCTAPDQKESPSQPWPTVDVWRMHEELKWLRGLGLNAVHVPAGPAIARSGASHLEDLLDPLILLCRKLNVWVVLDARSQSASSTDHNNQHNQSLQELYNRYGENPHVLWCVGASQRLPDDRDRVFRGLAPFLVPTTQLQQQGEPLTGDPMAGEHLLAHSLIAGRQGLFPWSWSPWGTPLAGKLATRQVAATPALLLQDGCHSPAALRIPSLADFCRRASRYLQITEMGPAIAAYFSPLTGLHLWRLEYASAVMYIATSGSQVSRWPIGPAVRPTQDSPVAAIRAARPADLAPRRRAILRNAGLPEVETEGCRLCFFDRRLQLQIETKLDRNRTIFLLLDKQGGFLAAYVHRDLHVGRFVFEVGGLTSVL